MEVDGDLFDPRCGWLASALGQILARGAGDSATLDQIPTTAI